jgi:hypothetical protein
MSLFQNRKLLIATKHQKERVIAPILERALGVICFVDETYDTDVLGTFTGEIEREHDPITTVREKCLQAMKKNNCDLGIASEGSFGPHPSLYFMHADDEFLIFIDSKNNIEVIVRELSTDTNFNGKHIQSEEELLAFAEQIGFPTHGIILRSDKNENINLYKGITDVETLKKLFNQIYLKSQSAYVETDMRAMYNPTRMSVIEQATLKLAAKINLCCPECHMPGFGVTEVREGLECSVCDFPTHATLSYIYVCQHCQFTKEELYPHQKTKEDPMYCDYCNP